ncbi:MAG: lysylphosphatidylglycerol synthase transmembrane domain-containing protein [Gemmatimonadaceae bacterium]
MKLSGKGVLGIAITAFCLYLAFRNVEWARAVETAKHANYWLLALSMVTATGMFPLRARRWRVILDPVVPNVPLGPLWRSIAIGMMVNNLALLRAGEIARAFAITREEPEVTLSVAVASIAVDRVFDAIVVLLLLAISVVASGFSATTKIGSYSIGHATAAFAAVPIVLLLGLYALVFYPATLIRVFELSVRPISSTLEQRGADMLRRFAAGLGVLKSPGHFIAVFWWTLLHWLLQPLAFWLALKALGISVPWPATLFLQGVIVILVALPSAPGFFGLFELGAKLALTLYGVSATDASTWGFIFHISSFIPITLIGGYYATRLGFRMGDVASASGAGA